MPRYQEGRVAKQLLLYAGDAEGNDGGYEGRLAILDRMRKKDLDNLDAGEREALRKPEARLANIERRIKRLVDRRAMKEAGVRTDADQKALWREADIQQYLSVWHWSPAAKAVVLAFLAGVDFTLFADAWAVVNDDARGSLGWFFGGLIGLAIFAAGFWAARAQKGLALARAQQEMLTEAQAGRHQLDPSEASKLVRHRADETAAFAITLLFLTFAVVAALVRWFGAPDEHKVLVIIQTLAPIVAATIEYYLYDPTHVRIPAPGPREHWYGLQKDRVNRLILAIQERAEAGRRQVDNAYAIERTWLELELADMGFVAPTQPRPHA